MKEIFKQLKTIWTSVKGTHKCVAVAILFLIFSTLCYAWYTSASHDLVPVFSNKFFTPSEIETIEAYLIEKAIPYQMDEKKGPLVAAEQLMEVKRGLGTHQKEVGAKGFELFDTNTWIKGEKELQVLEMRALKGQLEKDLTSFENIKSASVILDIPPQKSFNSSKLQTKASVILTLMPKQHLSASQLRAITNHIAGAVRGLEPQMIAISDTTGKLYQSIDPSGMDAIHHHAGLFFEEHVQEKVNALLSHFVGKDHFYSHVQAVLDKHTDVVQSLSIAALIDKDVVETQGNIRHEIERQLNSLAKGYGMDEPPLIDFISFGQKKIPLSETCEKKNGLGLLCTCLFIGLSFCAGVLWFWKGKGKKSQDDEAFFKLMTRVDMKKLSESMAGEDPQTIALMLSYLEPKRAEQLISSMKTELQEAVLMHLADFEKKGVE